MVNEYIAGLGLFYPLKNGKELVGAEIGVNQGVTSQWILQNLNISKLYLVDPWTAYGQNNPSAGSTAFTNEDAEAHYQETLKRIEPFKDKVEILRTTSKEAVKHIPDKSLDFVFIDGDHSYEHAKQDMELWYPKVKYKGIFAGHDYSHGDVNRAIREMCYVYHLGLQLTINDMWWALKENFK